MTAQLTKTEALSGERAIALALWREIGGETEAVCNIGRIDLLTESEVIEVKYVSRWVEAVE
jgi:hypothetical protein